jgi:hypothetical protein
MKFQTVLVVIAIIWAQWRYRRKIISLALNNDVTGMRRWRRWRRFVSLLCCAVMVVIFTPHSYVLGMLFGVLAALAIVGIISPDFPVSEAKVAETYRQLYGDGDDHQA